MADPHVAVRFQLLAPVGSLTATAELDHGDSKVFDRARHLPREQRRVRPDDRPVGGPHATLRRERVTRVNSRPPGSTTRVASTKLWARRSARSFENRRRDRPGGPTLVQLESVAVILPPETRPDELVRSTVRALLGVDLELRPNLLEARSAMFGIVKND